MAITTEPTGFQNTRGTSYVLADGATGGLNLRVQPGGMAVTCGGYTTIQGVNESGDFIGVPRKGPQAGPTIVALSNVLINGAGGNLSTLSLMDFKTQSGTPFGALTSADTESEYTTFTYTWQTADAGSLKGATYTLTSCTLEPGNTMAMAEDGMRGTFSLRSDLPYPTITEN